MTHQTNEELIKAFKNHLDYYKDLKDKWEFLKTPEDRAFHAGKTQGMLLGLEVIERISIPQPEQLELEVEIKPIFPEIGFNEDFFKVVYKNNGVWKTLFTAIDEIDCVKYLQRHNVNLTKEKHL